MITIPPRPATLRAVDIHDVVFMILADTLPPY